MSASECVFSAQGVTKGGLDMFKPWEICWFLNNLMFWKFSVFFVSGVFWASFLLIFGVLGGPFGSQKVDANFA